MRSPRRLLLVPPLAALSVAACATPPASPPSKSEVLLGTEGGDRRSGETEAERVAAELGLVDAPELTAYVSRLGQRLALHARGRPFDYSFAIVDQDAPNAFALPGGLIYLSRGLLARTNSEDELANVIAHEIAHVAAQRAAGRQGAASTAVNPMMLPGAVAEAVPGEARASPPKVFNLPYLARHTRDQEREADRRGQELAAEAGFDPGGLVAFLRDLENSERLRSGGSRLPGFLETHPTTSERVASAADRARQLRWRPGPGIARDRAAYLRRLDGLLLGVNPREGVFRGDRFLHPDLDFTLRFPEGWRRVNTPRAVAAFSPRRDAETFLQLQGRGEDPESAARDFLSKLPPELSLEVKRSEPMRIGRLDAHRVSGRTGAPREPADLEITWIAYGGQIYRITAKVRASSSRPYREALSGVARSFRSLTPAERYSIRVARLRIARPRPGECLEALSRRTGNVWDLQETAAMNSLFAGAAIDPGWPVKIAVEQPYLTRPAASDAGEFAE